MGKHFRTSLTIFGIGIGAFVAEALYSGNERFYRERVMPTLQWIIPDGDTAHQLALKSIKFGLFPRKTQNSFPDLRTNVFGLDFSHPVGLAAGFDKNGEAVSNLLDSGFSFVEVGSVTPLPQSGNPLPRIFRFIACQGIINRCGFNNDGHDAMYERLKSRQWEGKGIVGVNLGCNKTSPDRVGDYVAGVEKFGNIADYLVINVSSPNTPGLRSMQTRAALTETLQRVLAARDKLAKRTPVLLKISPDETDEALADIVAVATAKKTRIDGLIVSNTTLATKEQAEACGAHMLPRGASVYGGLSGKPLFDKSTACLAKVASLTQGQNLPLIGVGGVSDGNDAAAKLAAGASLVQLYSALVYQGTPVAHRVAKELNALRNPSGQEK